MANPDPGYLTEAFQWLAEHKDDLQLLLQGEPAAPAPASRPSKRQSAAICLRLRLDDLARARALAADQGIGYQTLIKELIREGLDRLEHAPRKLG